MKELLEFIYNVATGNFILNQKYFFILKLFKISLSAYFYDHYDMVTYSIFKITFIEV